MVKMQIKTAGIAIAKSKEIDFARLLKPDFFNSAKKKVLASYKGTPLKPGNIIRLLSLRTKATGVD
jgi:hypothetical protein